MAHTLYDAIGTLCFMSIAFVLQKKKFFSSFLIDATGRTKHGFSGFFFINNHELLFVV